MKKEIITMASPGDFFIHLIALTAGVILGVTFLIIGILSIDIMSIIISLFFFIAVIISLRSRSGAYLTRIEFKNDGMYIKNLFWNDFIKWDNVKKIQTIYIDGSKKLIEIHFLDKLSETKKITIAYTKKAFEYFKKYFSITDSNSIGE